MIALDIDYDNFKDAVAERQGWSREDLYEKVWSILQQLYCCDQRGVSEQPPG